MIKVQLLSAPRLTTVRPTRYTSTNDNERDGIIVDTMVEETIEKAYVLNAKDRCDKRDCGAQALVWVNLVSGDLLFCGHHYAKNEEALKPYAIEVIDERAKVS